MKKTRFTEEKMVLILQEADRTSVAAVAPWATPARFPDRLSRAMLLVASAMLSALA